MITGCPGDIQVPIATGGSYGEASWSEPTATDHNGVNVPVYERSHTQTRLYIGVGGSSRISYVFRDSRGNTAECAFFVTGVRGNHQCSLFYYYYYFF